MTNKKTPRSTEVVIIKTKHGQGTLIEKVIFVKYFHFVRIGECYGHFEQPTSPANLITNNEK